MGFLTSLAIAPGRAVSDGPGVLAIKRTLVIHTVIRHEILEYADNPCAVPNCPCMVDRLGLPQAAKIAALVERVREAKAARR
jgi:hypothetical protein